MFGRISTALLLAMAGALAVQPALAHTGLHIGGGFVAGLSHPFLGLDHLLAMLSVGALAAAAAARGQGRALWSLPLAFMAVMALGGALAMTGIALPATELGIAASLVVLGVMLAARIGLPLVAATALVAVFAFFHGHAHGAELPASASALAYGMGFVLASFLLHLAGIGLAQAFERRPAWSALSIRAAGTAVAATGIVLLIG
jgi:urease accessory protein